MAAWRYETSLLVLKNILLIFFQHSKRNFNWYLCTVMHRNCLVFCNQSSEIIGLSQYLTDQSLIIIILKKSVAKGAVQPQMARMEMDCNLKKIGQLFFQVSPAYNF